VSLRGAHEALTRALEPLGIEVGLEVLDVWQDRLAHGQDPLPAVALERLVATAQQLVFERRSAAAQPPE
jgi:hypothetical protein